MKQIRFILYGLFVAFFCACTENRIESSLVTGDQEGELEEVSLTLKSLPIKVIGEEYESEMQGKDTRQDDNSDVKESAIDNIWVFQYTSEGILLASPHYYSTTSSSGRGVPMEVMLRPAVNCQIYIVANTNNLLWAKDMKIGSSLSNLTSSTFTRSTENDMYGGTYKNLLMVGHASGKTVIAGKSNDLGQISLSRMVAKISFQFVMDTSVEDKLRITKVTINNVPSVLRVGEVTASPYPTTLTPCSMSDVNSPSTSMIYTWYVPENWQGTTGNNDEKKKNDWAPANAIYIRLHVDSDVDGSSYVYTIYPGENTVNDFNIKRNCFYWATLRVVSFATDNRVMAAPANCFVVTPKSSIVFDPYDRTENGGGWKYSDYVNKSVVSKKIASVRVLWQTAFAIGNNASGNLVYLKNDKIYVTAGPLNGTAVIAGYNSSDVIVWSWHIWVNSSAPVQVSNAVLYNTYEWNSNAIISNKRVRGRSFMSCNLGAISAGKGDGGAIGTYYQWGRKDPFPPNKLLTKGDAHYQAYSSTYVVAVYDNDTRSIEMSSSIGTGEVFNAVRTSSDIGTISYSIKHPTTFIASAKTPGMWDNNGGSNETPTHDTANYINEGDWYWGHNDRLWGGIPFSEASVNYKNIVANNGAEKKSIFDPCPSGWMLPPSDAWMGFTVDGLNHEGDNALNYANYGTEVVDNALALYMQYFKSGPTSLFPFCGWRNGDGSCYVVGYCGGYYTSAASYNYASSIFHIHPNLVHPYDYGYGYSRRACAYPIRCVREVKGS